MQNIDKIINLEKTSELLKKVKPHEDLIRNEINFRLASSGLLYNKQIFHNCINPLILNNDYFLYLDELSANLSSLMIDLIKFLQKNPELINKIIGSNTALKILLPAFLNMDPESIRTLFYRVDGIIKDNEIKLVEANMDCPGQTLSLQKIHEIGAEVYSNHFKYEFGFFRATDFIFNLFIDTYRSYCQKGELFLIIGKKDDFERAEHRLWGKKLRQAGIPAKTIDYRDPKIKQKRGRLYYGENSVGIVYRRVFPLDYNQDIMESEHGGTLLLNNIASSILTLKSLFAIFHEFKNSELLGHKSFIDRNIAYTAFVNDSNIDEILKNKDGYVLKEFNRDGGEGIFIGKVESRLSWEKIILRPETELLAQEYLEMPELLFTDNYHTGTNLRKFDFSLYCLGPKAIAPYCRVNAIGNYKANNSQGSSGGLCYF
ncbi:MAG: hypothetical protein WC675_05955 [Patescibacteria group bacterium]|jgi:glutathionylspermidine synthase